MMEWTSSIRLIVEDLLQVNKVERASLIAGYALSMLRTLNYSHKRDITSLLGLKVCCYTKAGRYREAIEVLEKQRGMVGDVGQEAVKIRLKWIELKVRSEGPNRSIMRSLKLLISNFEQKYTHQKNEDSGLSLVVGYLTLIKIEKLSQLSVRPFMVQNIHQIFERFDSLRQDTSYGDFLGLIRDKRSQTSRKVLLKKSSLVLSHQKKHKFIDKKSSKITFSPRKKDESSNSSFKIRSSRDSKSSSLITSSASNAPRDCNSHSNRPFIQQGEQQQYYRQKKNNKKKKKKKYSIRSPHIRSKTPKLKLTPSSGNQTTMTAGVNNEIPQKTLRKTISNPVPVQESGYNQNAKGQRQNRKADKLSQVSPLNSGNRASGQMGISPISREQDLNKNKRIFKDSQWKNTYTVRNSPIKGGNYTAFGGISSLNSDSKVMSSISTQQIPQIKKTTSSNLKKNFPLKDIYIQEETIVNDDGNEEKDGSIKHNNTGLVISAERRLGAGSYSGKQTSSSLSKMNNTKTPDFQSPPLYRPNKRKKIKEKNGGEIMREGLPGLQPHKMENDLKEYFQSEVFGYMNNYLLQIKQEQVKLEQQRFEIIKEQNRLIEVQNQNENPKSAQRTSIMDFPRQLQTPKSFEVLYQAQNKQINDMQGPNLETLKRRMVSFERMMILRLNKYINRAIKRQMREVFLKIKESPAQREFSTQKFIINLNKEILIDVTTPQSQNGLKSPEEIKLNFDKNKFKKQAQTTSKKKSSHQKINPKRVKMVTDQDICIIPKDQPKEEDKDCSKNAVLENEKKLIKKLDNNSTSLQKKLLQKEIMGLVENNIPRSSIVQSEDLDPEDISNKIIRKFGNHKQSKYAAFKPLQPTKEVKSNLSYSQTSFDLNSISCLRYKQSEIPSNVSVKSDSDSASLNSRNIAKKASSLSKNEQGFKLEFDDSSEGIRNSSEDENFDQNTSINELDGVEDQKIEINNTRNHQLPRRSLCISNRALSSSKPSIQSKYYPNY